MRGEDTPLIRVHPGHGPRYRPITRAPFDFGLPQATPKHSIEHMRKYRIKVRQIVEFDAIGELCPVFDDLSEKGATRSNEAQTPGTAYRTPLEVTCTETGSKARLFVNGVHFAAFAQLCTGILTATVSPQAAALPVLTMPELTASEGSLDQCSSFQVAFDHLKKSAQRQQGGVALATTAYCKLPGSMPPTKQSPTS